MNRHKICYLDTTGFKMTLEKFEQKLAEIKALSPAPPSEIMVELETAYGSGWLTITRPETYGETATRFAEERARRERDQRTSKAFAIAAERREYERLKAKFETEEARDD